MDVRQVAAGKNHGGRTQYTNYRIPGLVVTKENTLIMYYEARMAADDWADMDILAFRSENGGESFGEPIVLAAGAQIGRTVNNPVMIVGNDGILHFLYCVEYGVCVACGDAATAACPHGVGVFYRRSADDGLTWSEPVNITDSTAPDQRYVFAVGPGHGVCLPDGTLVATVWMVKKENAVDGDILAHHLASVSTLYSKDHGATWCLGEILPNVVNADGSLGDHNETMCAVTSDGGVMLTIRTHDVGVRALAWSKTGYSGWSPIVYDETLVDAVCMGSAVAYEDGAQPYSILHVNCADAIRSRKNLTLRVSTDNGKTWPKSKVIEPEYAGYSDIAVDSKGTIYVLYEVKAGQTCNLARLTYDEL